MSLRVESPRQLFQAKGRPFMVLARDQAAYAADESDLWSTYESRPTVQGPSYPMTTLRADCPDRFWDQDHNLAPFEQFESKRYKRDEALDIGLEPTTALPYPQPMSHIPHLMDRCDSWSDESCSPTSSGPETLVGDHVCEGYGSPDPLWLLSETWPSRVSGCSSQQEQNIFYLTSRAHEDHCVNLQDVELCPHQDSEIYGQESTEMSPGSLSHAQLNEMEPAYSMDPRLGSFPEADTECSYGQRIFSSTDHYAHQDSIATPAFSNSVLVTNGTHVPKVNGIAPTTKYGLRKGRQSLDSSNHRGRPGKVSENKSIQPSTTGHQNPRRRVGRVENGRIGKVRSKKSASNFHCQEHPGKAFKNQTELKHHMASQHASRPFPCLLRGLCSSTFGSKNEWKRHISTQHLILGHYECHECNIPGKKNGSHTGPKQFNRKDLFTSHVRRMHAPRGNNDSDTSATKQHWEQHRLPEIQKESWVSVRDSPQQVSCTCDNVYEGSNAWESRVECLGRHYENGDAISGRLDPELSRWMLNEGLLVQCAGDEEGFDGVRFRTAEDEDAYGEDD